MTYYAWANSDWNLLEVASIGLGLYDTPEEANRGPHLGHQKLYRFTVEEIGAAAGPTSASPAEPSSDARKDGGVL